jgi:hypothetical protein
LERSAIISAQLILALGLITNSGIFVSNYQIVYSQYTGNNTSNYIYSWVSKSIDLNITIQFEPKIPIIYYQTKILFYVNHLNGSGYDNNITAFVTVLDNEGGLYKFGNLKLSDGKFFVNYIFQNNLQNKIIVQLYKNNSGFALASFNIQLHASAPPPANNNSGNFFSNLFKNFFK